MDKPSKNRKAVEKACEKCGKVFLPAGLRPRKYCSHACYMDVVRDNGKIIGDTKQCAKCLTHKKFEFFPIQPSGRAGLAAYCKPCTSVVFHEMRGTPVEKRKPYQPAKKLSDEEKKRRVSEYGKNYRKNNKAKVAMWNRLRRHNERAQGPMPHRYEIGRMLCEQDARCVYCDTLLSGAYHIDHKQPVSRDGGNDIENLQLLCVKCNTTKGAKTHEEFLALLGRAS